MPEFDLVICDEAHRTTGVTLKDEDDSNFVRIHSNDYVAASKRLYMTATPRIFGDAASRGFVVPEGTQNLPRELYVLRLSGDVTAYLGRHVDGAAIYKIGLSVSPDLRRQALQKSMPRGIFRWKVARSTRLDGHAPYNGFAAAVAGEDAMKRHLARKAEWLGGEFYLASEAEIETAWRLGHEAATLAESDQEQ
jgi:hypothetical protein